MVVFTIAVKREIATKAGAQHLRLTELRYATKSRMVYLLAFFGNDATSVILSSSLLTNRMDEAN